MRKTKIAALVAGSALMLGACGGAPASEGPRTGMDHTPNNIMVFEVQISTGTVECIFAKNGYGGGLSCDW